MRFLKMFAGSMVAVSLMVAPAAFAADTTKMGHDMGSMGNTANMDEFMKSCDMNHDGMMSKDEMLKHMEKMFDKMDTKKTGKLDKKQTEAFLKAFTSPGGA
jgi:Ca2+-binding EF-hand superfamily protein